MSTILIGAGIVLLTVEKPVYAPVIFVFAMAGGIIFWLVINKRESLKRKEENFRRKLKWKK